MLAHQKEVQIFAMSMEDIDRQLALNRECQVEEISLKDNAVQHMKDVQRQLPVKYHEYLDVFDHSQANQLPPHRLYNHKIELAGEAVPPQS